jgi:hypothetical protein
MTFFSPLPDDDAIRSIDRILSAHLNILAEAIKGIDAIDTSAPLHKHMIQMYHESEKKALDILTLACDHDAAFLKCLHPNRLVRIIQAGSLPLMQRLPIQETRRPVTLGDDIAPAVRFGGPGFARAVVQHAAIDSSLLEIIIPMAQHCPEWRALAGEVCTTPLAMGESLSMWNSLGIRSNFSNLVEQYPDVIPRVIALQLQEHLPLCEGLLSSICSYENIENSIFGARALLGCGATLNPNSPPYTNLMAQLDSNHCRISAATPCPEIQALAQRPLGGPADPRPE